jgi:hypothetical protein
MRHHRPDIRCKVGEIVEDDETPFGRYHGIERLIACAMVIDEAKFGTALLRNGENGLSYHSR